MLHRQIALYSVERDVFSIAITAAYARPFKQKRAVQLSADIVPEKFKETHGAVILMRDKVIAHRDLDGPQAEWGFVSDLLITVTSGHLELNTISPKITDDLGNKLLSLTSFLIDVLDLKINAFVGKHFGRIVHNQGIYVVGLDENPSDWLFKKMPQKEMTIVPQISPLTCTLACLEAHFRDNGIPFTQQTLIKDYPIECSTGVIKNGEDRTGALTDRDFVTLCDALAIPIRPIRNYRREVILQHLTSLTPGQSAILFISKYRGGSEQHAVRFYHVDANDEVHFMCPSFGQGTMTIQNFSEWEVAIMIVG